MIRFIKVWKHTQPPSDSDVRVIFRFNPLGCVLVEQIMGMEMGMPRGPMKVGMLVNEVHPEQQVLVSQNRLRTSCPLDTVLFGEDCDPGPQLGNQPEIMSCKDDRLSRLAEG